MMGTNDIGGNTGPMTLDQTEGNFETILDLARLHHIDVVVAALPPSTKLDTRRIAALNRWLKSLAGRPGVVFADYASALETSDGNPRPGLMADGVHPSASGYRAMEPVARSALSQFVGGA